MVLSLPPQRGFPAYSHTLINFICNGIVEHNRQDEIAFVNDP
jgi:hypothetical protein